MLLIAFLIIEINTFRVDQTNVSVGGKTLVYRAGCRLTGARDPRPSLRCVLDGARCHSVSHVHAQNPIMSSALDWSCSYQSIDTM